LTVPIDVIFEPGWQVFVDGKLVKAIGSDKAETPCTVELPLGKHEIGLAKDGFMDIKQQLEIKEDGVKGTFGILLRSSPTRGLGQLTRIEKDKTEIIFEETMGYVVTDLKQKVYAHRNSQEKIIGEIPKELVGKKYTQLVSQKPGTVKVKFITSGKVYFCTNWNPLIQFLEKNNGVLEDFQVFGWSTYSIIGKQGKEILFPYQIMIIADILTKGKIP